MTVLLSTRRQLRVRLFFEGALVGIFTGAVVAALRYLPDEAYRPQAFAHVDSLGKIFFAVGVMILLATLVRR